MREGVPKRPRFGRLGLFYFAANLRVGTTFMIKLRQYFKSAVLGFFSMALCVHCSSVFADDIQSKAINACRDVREKAFLLGMANEHEKNQRLAKEIIIDGIKVVADRHFLSAYINSDESDDVVSVKQMDYGEIDGIFLDRQKGIIAIGDQASYRVKVKKVSGKAQFYQWEKLPTLYRKRCGVLGQFLGECQIARAYSSKELSVAFASGFDYLGIKRSYAFGLDAVTTVKDLRIPPKGLAYYLFDIPRSGGAVFQGDVGLLRGNYYFFNGNNFLDCNSLDLPTSTPSS